MGSKGFGDEMRQQNTGLMLNYTFSMPAEGIAFHDLQGRCRAFHVGKRSGHTHDPAATLERHSLRI